MNKQRENTTKEIEGAFKKHYKELCLFAVTYVEDLETAEDMVQDIFVKLISQNKDVSTIQNLRAYLYNSTRNTCLNYLDHNKRKLQKEEVFLKQMSQTDSIEEYMIEIDRKTEIYKAIEELPEQCKKTFLLCNINELKYKEAAEELNVSVNTVKSHMKKAYQLLRKTVKRGYFMFF